MCYICYSKIPNDDDDVDDDDDDDDDDDSDDEDYDDVDDDTDVDADADNDHIDKYYSENWIVFQVTLRRRNGPDSYDYRHLWWDELGVDGIVTSFVRLDILHASTGIRVLELEFYTGHGWGLY